VLAGLARVLSVLPNGDPHRGLYLRDFQDMARAISAVQRSDGFWNANLGDPDDDEGPEFSGSSLFVYGMAWGVRSGHLDETAFKPAIVSGWHAMASAVPADDVGLGCFLLGGSEVARLAAR
jgi:rhamnogalacturonyl hydrolase YesR